MSSTPEVETKQDKRSGSYNLRIERLSLSEALDKLKDAGFKVTLEGKTIVLK